MHHRAMRHLGLPRRVPRHRLMIHRPPPPGAGQPRQGGKPARLSDLILAMLGVTLLGGLALMAAASLMARSAAP